MWRRRLFATTSGALVSKGATILTALLLFRLVPASDLGRYTAALTLVGFCAILGNAGLNQLTTREVARLDGQAGRAWFGALLPLRLLLALGAYALLVLVALLVPGLVDARLALIAGLLLLPDALAAAFSSAITGQGRAALASWLDALRNVIGLAATLGLLFFWHAGVWALAWLLVGLAVWALVSNMLVMSFTADSSNDERRPGSSNTAGNSAWRLKSRLRAYGHKTRLRGLGRMMTRLGRGVREGGLGGGTPLGAVLTASLRLWRPALAAAVPLGLGALAATLYFRVDTLFLSAARGGRDVAYYSAPYQIVESFWLISTSWNAVALPMLAKRYDARLVERSIALLVSIGLPASLFISIRAEDVARLVFGAGYLPAALPLRLVIWVVPMLFSYVPIVTALFVHEYQQQVFSILLANLGLVIVLDALLIPPFGVLGASIATLIVEAGALAGYLWLAHRAGLGIRYLHALGRPALLSAPIAGVLLLGQGLPFLLLLALVIVLWAALFGLEWRSLGFLEPAEKKGGQMAEPQKRIRCVGCGALVPDIDGPTHRYVGASPGCWQIHGEVQVKEYEEYHSQVAQMLVDTYCVQHPGVPGPQSRQSVAVHLMSMCLVLERGMPPAKMPRILPQFTHKEYPWLEPPADPGALTIVDVEAARDLEEHTRLVKAWAQAVWEAWATHQATVRGWLDSAPVRG